MFAKLITILVWGSIVAALVSCNIYAPFDSKSSDNDYVEAAQKCLHNNDYSCAVENYSKINSAELKSQHLCLVYLAKAGFTISALVNTVKNNSQTMLGTLATQMIPWSSQKTADAASAMTQCDAYAGFAASGQTGILLKDLSHLVDCATQLAKSDQFIGSAPGDTTCTTAGNRDGKVSKADVNSGGVANVMCDADAVRCATDFNTMDTSSLGSDLNDIKTAIQATEGAGGLAGATGTPVAARAALDASVDP
jgi:hypothetical protein